MCLNSFVPISIVQTAHSFTPLNLNWFRKTAMLFTMFSLFPRHKVNHKHGTGKALHNSVSWAQMKKLQSAKSQQLANGRWCHCCIDNGVVRIVDNCTAWAWNVIECLYGQGTHSMLKSMATPIIYSKGESLLKKDHQYVIEWCFLNIELGILEIRAHLWRADSEPD